MVMTRDGHKALDVAPELATGICQQLFPAHLELVPQVNELYELELAACESRILTDSELIRNSAYFARVGGTLTRHFLMCSGEPVRLPQHSSSRLKSFFQTNQFRTGYATHGLFPYRGKFHPQMVKALLNVMGLKPGETVLDPMMGSGTVLIEATLMGMKSIGIDASPFCRFMVQSKLDGLTVPLEPVRQAVERFHDLFAHFKNAAGHPGQGSKKRNGYATGDMFSTAETSGDYLADGVSDVVSTAPGTTDVDGFLLLAYLDSAGYSERSNRKPPQEQFRAILERYLFVSEKIQRVIAGVESELAEATPLLGDARALPLGDCSVDGILFSPPYSFAIDYLANDSFHLALMGASIDKLRESMVGLRGQSVKEKFDLYVDDMEKVLSECARVLRPGRICTIVVGTNDNQLSKALGVPADEVCGLDEILTDIACRHDLRLVRKLSRQIVGIANTMRNEYIVFLQRQ